MMPVMPIMWVPMVMVVKVSINNIIMKMPIVMNMGSDAKGVEVYTTAAPPRRRLRAPLRGGSMAPCQGGAAAAPPRSGTMRKNRRIQRAKTRAALKERKAQLEGPPTADPEERAQWEAERLTKEERAELQRKAREGLGL